ncbi:MAG: hypothetical protein KDE20_19745 [Caldilineaceae bacterium]|nr:hypothetical protein [Caldilineaceae bacterium]
MSDALKALLIESDQLARVLELTAEELGVCIALDLNTKRELKEAEEYLAQAEAERIAEAVTRAKVEKAGPLAHVAQSSPAFRSAVDTVVKEARQNGLAPLHRRVTELRTAADEAQIAREQVSVRFSAMKRAADLRSAMLRTLSS